MKPTFDNNAPTPPLDEFVRAYEEDDNEWWMLSCGHHQNLFDAALERIDELEARLKVALDAGEDS